MKAVGGRDVAGSRKSGGGGGLAETYSINGTAFIMLATLLVVVLQRGYWSGALEAGQTLKLIARKGSLSCLVACLGSSVCTHQSSETIFAAVCRVEGDSGAES